jgi:DNA-binding phage protein/ribosomal protein S27E
MQPTSVVVHVRRLECNVLQQDEHVPPRSRLYSLAPREIGTIWCESLTGYINRLGWTHHVSPRALAAQEIVPRLDEHLRLVTPVGVFGTKWAMSLNGAGVMTKPWTLVLNHLTTRSDLHLLTLPSWIGDLSPRWQVRETPAWCPSCFCEWWTSGYPIYQPLLWMIRVVTLCPHHRTLLVNRCPRCQKPQLVFASNTTHPGECTSCAHWLGKETNVLSDQEVSTELMAWQEWIWATLEEFQAASLTSGTLTWEPFFRHLATYLQEQKGHSRLAQATGIDRTVLYRWVDPDDAYHPTLETILKFCYVCQITPLQVMNGQLDQLQQTIQRGTELRSPLPRRQHQRVDRERCQMALQAALESREEPLALYQVARRLGYKARQLAYHFPEECKLVKQRARDYRQQRKERYLVQVGEQVRQAVFSLHAQGIYPSLHKVQSFLAGGSMQMPEARETWHATLRELGLES